MCCRSTRMTIWKWCGFMPWHLVSAPPHTLARLAYIEHEKQTHQLTRLKLSYIHMRDGDFVPFNILTYTLTDTGFFVHAHTRTLSNTRAHTGARLPNDLCANTHRLHWNRKPRFMHSYTLTHEYRPISAMSNDRLISIRSIVDVYCNHRSSCSHRVQCTFRATNISNNHQIMVQLLIVLGSEMHQTFYTNDFEYRHRFTIHCTVRRHHLHGSLDSKFCILQMLKIPTFSHRYRAQPKHTYIHSFYSVWLAICALCIAYTILFCIWDGCVYAFLYGIRYTRYLYLF